MGKKNGLTIGKVRSGLYTSARVLGDINAVQRGTIPARIGTRIIGPMFSRIFGSLIRTLFGRR